MAEVKRRRAVRKSLAFTAEEWERVEERMALASERSFQEFALSAILEGRITVVRQMFDPSAVRVELSRIGNNVNQVARLANTHEAATAQDVAEVARLLREVQVLITEASSGGA